MGSSSGKDFWDYYRKQSSENIVFNDMFEYCKLPDPRHRQACCGADEKCKSDCSLKCTLLFSWPNATDASSLKETSSGGKTYARKPSGLHQLLEHSSGKKKKMDQPIYFVPHTVPVQGTQVTLAALTDQKQQDDAEYSVTEADLKEQATNGKEKAADDAED